MTTADYDFININADYKRLDELFGNPEQLSYETFSERVKGTEIALTCNTEKKMILLYTTYMLRDFKKSIGEPTFLTTTEVILGIYFFCGEQKYDEIFSDDGI